jgi:hypothetical protein
VADLAEAVATLPGVRAAVVEKGETVAHADRDALLPIGRNAKSGSTSSTICCRYR